MEDEKPTRIQQANEPTRLAPRPKSKSSSLASAAKTLARDPNATEVNPNAGSDDDSTATEINPDAQETEVSGDTRLQPTQTHSVDHAAPISVHGKTASTANSVFAKLDRKIAEEYKGKKLLKNRFALLDTLGSGGMGNVYLAKDLLREEMEDSAPFVAIKVLNEQCRNLPGALQSLQREAKKAQALSHPNIVTVYDFDRDGETAFITMEYIDGKELKDHLRNHKRMPHKKAMFVIERVARGLAYAHQQGFAHSDIKPANIFLAEDGTVKILDFGIAKAFKDAVKEKRTLADELTEGALTPTYASTEMLEGETPVASDDVYALACMAYEMLAGHHPFVGEDGKPMPANIAKQKGAKVELIPHIPKRHMRAIRKGLSFSRAERFKDAGLFIDAIKPRNLKKDFAMLASAAVVTGAVIFVVNQGIEQVVPSVNSLKPELVEVTEAVIEADQFLDGGEIDMAHRLYSQAWELGNDLTVEDVDEREKLHAILRDRMGKVADHLIGLTKQSDMDEYRLRELYVAIEFLLKDEITDDEKKLKKALANIDKKLNAK